MCLLGGTRKKCRRRQGPWRWELGICLNFGGAQFESDIRGIDRSDRLAMSDVFT